MVVVVRGQAKKGVRGKAGGIDEHREGAGWESGREELCRALTGSCKARRGGREEGEEGERMTRARE